MMANNEQSFKEFNSTFSKSMTQLCTSHLLANIKIPRFDAHRNVFEFIAEFESVTASLGDEQSLPLLSKAFPVGCYRPWYETKLKPIIDGGSTWAATKKIIIERFSATADQDRHLRRALEMKFDPDGHQKLLDFIEELAYSYSKSNRDGDSSNAMLVRFIKAAIPDSLHPILNNYAAFKDAKDEDMLKEAAKQYDLIKLAVPSRTTADGIKKELTDIVKDLMKDVRKEVEETRQCFKAALMVESKPLKDQQASIRPDDPYARPRSPYRGRSPDPREQYRPGTPTRNGHYRRQPSPARVDYYRRDYEPRRQDYYISDSKDHNGNYSRRSPSPRRSGQYNYSRYPSARSGETLVKLQNDSHGEDLSIAFDSKLYFDRFKKPPSACSHCGQMHWDRHCPRHLN